MRSSRRALIPLLALALAVSSCGATLTRGPTGWHEDRAAYSMTALPNGDLFPTGWRLDGYSVKSDGFARGRDLRDDMDLRLLRTEDDGVVVITSLWLKEEDRQKRP